MLRAAFDTLAEYLTDGSWGAAVSALTERACELTASPVGLVGAVLEHRFLKVFAANGPAAHLAGACLELASEDPALVELVECARPVCVAHDLEHPLTGFPPVEGLLAVPVAADGEVIGLIAVAGRPGGYGPAEVDALTLFARAASALFASHAREQVRETQIERLRREHKMDAVGTLAAGVAHHFNNLLMIMMGNAELILAKSGSDASLRRHAEMVHGAGRRAAELTARLTAFQRYPSPTAELFDLNRLAERLLASAAGALPADVHLHADLDLRPTQVFADRAAFEQVLAGLIANAGEALPAGGTITVQTSHADVEPGDTDLHTPPRPGRYAVLAVSDTGAGLSPVAVSHLFEPFYTTKLLGAGLSLYTAWGLVRRSGGDITVDSRPGGGTTVRVFLPRAAPAVRPPD